MSTNHHYVWIGFSTEFVDNFFAQCSIYTHTRKDNHLNSAYKFLTAITLTSLLFSSPVLASLKNKTYGSLHVAAVTSIYDADTFRVDIANVPAVIGERMAVRVAGIDAAEMRGKCEKEKQLARKAKQFTVSLLRGAKTIELRNIKRGKYFRLVADVIIDGNVSLSKSLIKHGHAVPYFGGKKVKNWCN